MPQKKEDNQLFESVVNSDPTIKFYLREGSLNMLQSFSFGSKIDLRIWAFKEALKRYLDIKYPTPNISCQTKNTTSTTKQTGS